MITKTTEVTKILLSSTSPSKISVVPLTDHTCTLIYLKTNLL